MEKARRAVENGYQDEEKVCVEICNLIITNVEDKIPTMFGETPFYKAADFGQIEICKLFIDNLVNKNPCNDDGNTPLHAAAGSGHLEV